MQQIIPSHRSSFVRLRLLEAALGAYKGGLHFLPPSKKDYEFKGYKNNLSHPPYGSLLTSEAKACLLQALF